MLMHPEGMNFSWNDLATMPAYVKRYCWDILQIRYRVQAEKRRNP